MSSQSGGPDPSAGPDSAGQPDGAPGPRAPTGRTRRDSRRRLRRRAGRPSRRCAFRRGPRPRCGPSACPMRPSTRPTSGTTATRPAGVFSELLGTFFLVLVAVGGGMVNARFGGHAIPGPALVVAPALMVVAVILFMGNVSGAHLNPAVSLAFAARGDFPWRRVPYYILAQLAGAVLATLALWAFVGRHGGAGLALPGGGIPTASAMLWEALLTCGLVSVILGTASGAQQLRPDRRDRGRQLHRAGRPVRGPGQRGVHEPGPVARPRPGPGRLDVLVGLPRWPADRRGRRRWHRPPCAAPAAARPAPTPPRAPWARSGSPAGSATPTRPPATPTRPPATLARPLPSPGPPDAAPGHVGPAPGS